MDILELARKSGMTVTLDARIGREEYRTVHGSVAALERFPNGWRHLCVKKWPSRIDAHFAQIEQERS